MPNRALIIFLIVVIIALTGVTAYLLGKNQAKAPVSPADVLSPPVSNTTSTQDIVVSSPSPDSEIKSPLIIEGEATGPWYFEAIFNARLLDSEGKILGETILTAQGDWMTVNLVPFRGELAFQNPQTATGTLLFLSSNPSGLPEHQKSFEVSVKFAASKNVTKVKTYFNNSKLDPEFSCNKVFAAEREVEKTQKLATAALAELLKGPTEDEKSQGFFSSIPLGVQIQSLVIENGIAKADFSETLQTGVGGSCRVSAIRSEITETLKQFSTVREVIISIGGRTEDILQP